MNRSRTRSSTSAAPRNGSADSNTCREYALANGMRVLLLEDHTTPMVTIDVLYHVGSKNEEPGKTGFAHLFEHLMFDGSRNVPRGGYDLHCTSVGGDNNAYTSSDLTNYHISLPCDQIALGLWLESDRMAGFGIEQISLDTQKRVVIEEKRQTCNDVPYGDMIENMRAMSYDPAHPYHWEVDGSIEDVQGATMEDVRRFYGRFYVPSNATLVVAGDFETDEAMTLVDHYFASIPAGKEIVRPRYDPALRRFGDSRRLESVIVPFNAVFMAWHAPDLHDADLRALELLSMILADGESSRLYQELEYEQQIASDTESFIDEGEIGSLFYVYAIAQNRKVTTRRLKEALLAEIGRLATDGVTERELQKAKNRKLTGVTRSLQSISNRAERLAYFREVFGDASLAFREVEMYESISAGDLQRVARTYLLDAEPNVVEYLVKSA